MAVTSQSITHATSLGPVLREGSVRAVRQPIVGLDTPEVAASALLAPVASR